MNFDLCSILSRGVACVHCVWSSYKHVRTCMEVYVHVYEKFAECTDRSHLWIPMDHLQPSVDLPCMCETKHVIKL